MKRKGLTVLLLAIVYVAPNRGKYLERFPPIPHIKEGYPGNVTALIHETVTLVCPDVFDRKWRVLWIGPLVEEHDFKTNPIYSLDDIIQSENPEDEAEQLTLYNISKENEGWYICYVSNYLGDAMARGFLSVLEYKGMQSGFKNIPSFKENTSAINIEKEVALSAPKFQFPYKLYKRNNKVVGDSVRLKCNVKGNPTPNITWYKNKNTPITRSYFAPSYGKWSLLLKRLTTRDDGNYTCVICNQLGCINHTTELKVLKRYPSKLKERYLGNVTALLNDTVRLACPPGSDLEMYLYWIRPWKSSMKEYNFESSSFKEIPLGDVIKSQDPEDNPEHLTLDKVTKEDEGWYVCVAPNNVGGTAAGFLSVSERLPSSEALEKLKQEQPTSLLSIIVTVFCASLIVSAMVVVTIYRKLKREKKQKRLALETARDVIETFWNKKVTIEKPHINNSPNASGALVLPKIKIEKQKVSEVKKNTNGSRMLSEYELPLDEDWEVPRETVELGMVLGEGEFGKVVKADCVGLLRRGQSTVAVKMLKDEHTDAEMTALISEMEIMKVVGKHVNIINLLGCCTQGGPLYVIVEFALYGSLRDFLRNYRLGMITERNESLEVKRNLTPQDLVSFAYQAAKGMEYLASRHCIHRDLAARNVLVSENFILKIADFGLAKNIEVDYYYRKKTSGKLPVRWMAPESLTSMLFTIQTDVWSFGILLWEIMTLGATPYQTIQGQYLFQHLRAGHRLEKPSNCSLDLYLIMRECWSFSPKGRPSFTVLVKELEKILTTMTNPEYLDLGPSKSETSQVTKTLWLSRNPSLLPEKEGQLLTTNG